ncbi:MAG: transglycosylase SLT domain-containing protein, partial [Gammaproteobacteria bacterium]
AAAGMLLAAAGGQAATTEPPTPQLRALLVKAIHSSTSFKDRFDAEVWLMDMSHRLAPTVPDPKTRIGMLKAVHEEAARAHLPPNLVLAVIQVESNFHRFAISSAGAQGLMQIMPFWLKVVGEPNGNLFHLHTNLRIGCTILRYYLQQAHGDYQKALARYNGSVGKSWYPDRVFQTLQTRWYRQ